MLHDNVHMNINIFKRLLIHFFCATCNGSDTDVRGHFLLYQPKACYAIGTEGVYVNKS